MLNLSAHESDVPPALSNRRGWEYFDQKLGELRERDIESILARGQLLIEAHEELERGSYEATVKRHMDLGDARKYRIIAAHPVISNRGHVHALPPSMRTLYELTRLPHDVLQAKLRTAASTRGRNARMSPPGASSSAAGQGRRQVSRAQAVT